MGDKSVMSSRQSAELDHAFERHGWTAADVKALSSGNMAARVVSVVRGQAVVVPIPAYPADGEVFELTLDGGVVDPIAMARGDGYIESDKWKFKGSTFYGRQTRRFKWVAVGYCRGWNALQHKLAQHGKIPEGQWREAVKGKFRPDGQHHRGIADASWVLPNGYANFPYVRSDGCSDFNWAGGGFDGDWRWLVEVSE